MSYRFTGRAFVDPGSPSAFAICDRCNGLYNHKDLRFQFEYNGTGLYNTRMLVCERCLDVPQAQFLNPILQPDPLPVVNPRVPAYSVQENGPDQDLAVQILTSEAAITTFYLDLFYGDPLDGGSSVLPQITGSATRQDFASLMAAPVADVTSNNAVISFTSSSLASINVDYLAVYDAATSGNLLMSGRLLVPQTVVLYNGAQFAIGDLQVALNQ